MSTRSSLIDMQESTHRRLLEIDLFAPWILSHDVLPGTVLSHTKIKILKIIIKILKIIIKILKVYIVLTQCIINIFIKNNYFYKRIY